MRIGIINGPNLNLLGTREPEKYGNRSFEDYFSDLQFKFRNVELSYDQTNIEGELIDKKYFVADVILAKHDENYMPPEVSKALEKSNY